MDEEDSPTACDKIKQLSGNQFGNNWSDFFEIISPSNMCKNILPTDHKIFVAFLLRAFLLILNTGPFQLLFHRFPK